MPAGDGNFANAFAVSELELFFAYSRIWTTLRHADRTSAGGFWVPTESTVIPFARYKYETSDNVAVAPFPVFLQYRVSILMRRIGTVTLLVFCAAFTTAAQAQRTSSNADGFGASGAAQPAPAQPQAATIDSIAVHIGNDVVTESEVRELEDYQELLDGHAQSRAQVLQELVDQWIVRTEAATMKFPKPNTDEINQEFQTLLKHFPSAADFQSRLAAVSLTQDELRRVISRQIYYVRFLNYKFHAAAEVTSAQIEAYYQQQLSPQLQKPGSAIPPLNQVESQIRQLLTQKQINQKASQWLEEAKARLKIVVQPSGGGG